MRNILKKVLWKERKYNIILSLFILGLIPKIYKYLENRNERILCISILFIIFIFCFVNYSIYLYQLKHDDKPKVKVVTNIVVSLLILLGVIILLSVFLLKLNIQILSKLKNQSELLTFLLPVMENILLFPLYSNMTIAVFFSGGIFSKNYFIIVGKMIKDSYIGIVLMGGILTLSELFIQKRAIIEIVTLLSCINSIVLWGIVLLYAEKNFDLGEWINERKKDYIQKNS